METAVLRGTAYYAMLTKPDTKYDSDGIYKVSLIPDEESLKKIKKIGLNIKEETETVPGEHVILKRRHVGKNKVNGPVPVIDAKKQPVSVIVGNGSEIKVSIAYYDTANGNVGTFINKVQVLDLVPYVKDDFDYEDGWTADEASTEQEDSDTAPEVDEEVVEEGEDERL